MLAEDNKMDQDRFCIDVWVQMYQELLFGVQS